MAVTETEYEENLRMAAWAINAEAQDLSAHFHEIASDIKVVTGRDIQLTDLRPEFLGAYHSCNEEMRASLRRFFVRHLLDDVKEQDHCK
jgi:hypothetical protein